MQKTFELFLQRIEQKRYLQQSQKKKFVESGEIWLWKVGVNVGGEISKDGDFVRPFLVLKTGIGGDLVTGIPLTTKFNGKYADQVVFFHKRETHGLSYPSYFVLNQTKTVSILRLVSKLNNRNSDLGYINKVPQSTITILKQKIIEYIF